MPRISFVKNKASFEVPAGANLMKSLLEHGHPVASSCRGEGVCSKCVVRVIKGADQLSNPSELEVQLKKKNNVGPNLRISCQTQVNGDITVDTGYW